MKSTLRNTKALLPVVFFFVCTILPMISFGQIGVGTDEPEVTDTPIDGGVILLVIAGVAFGAYTLYKNHRKNQLALSN